ncbi:CubicO group peptidase (beta-lactamase class C family) [Pedobacter sp. CAN_A7]|uniref:serine hydrolase n=1 Tax=Pedobacter sp. CAN_A7 TaxID=2787722 RepID=UPI0018CA5EA0
MILKHYFATFIAVLALPILSIAQQTQSQQQPSNSIDVFVNRLMQQRQIPGLQLTVVRDGKIIKNANYGSANLEYSIKTKPETIFSINSITKAFVGVAIMQLAEDGKLKVTDPLSLHLDSLPADWQKVTLAQVLSHTSGLPDILDADEQVMGHGVEQVALDQVKKMPMEFKTGDRFGYNQTGYVLLGKIITKLSGVLFTKYIEDRQFKVAEMKLTRFGDSYDVIPNYAGAYTMTRQVGHSFVRNSSPGVAYMQFPEFFRTAAGIQSTATDMANWIIALTSGKLLKHQNSLSTLWTPAQLNNGKIGGFNQLTNGYALGWPTVTRDEHPAVAPVGGGRSAFFIYPKDNLSIVVLSNLMGANPDRFIDEIAGYYIPDMRESNGFGLPPVVKKLRAGLLKAGFNNTSQVIANLKKADPTIEFHENDLNNWGYQLLKQEKNKEALAIFTLNTTLHPQSANAYDSLGEMQEIMGNNKEAVINYKKSLSLNPENKNAGERLSALSAN